MKLRVHLDMSVFNALLDDRTPERREATEEFWGHIGDYDVSTSEVTVREIAECTDDQRRVQSAGLLDTVSIIELTAGMENLANQYIAAGVFTMSRLDDALHVAAAVLTRHDLIIAWNFKHLVNRRRRSMINAVGVSLGLPPVEIVSPLEL